jgi:hypothetical protein
MKVKKVVALGLLCATEIVEVAYGSNQREVWNRAAYEGKASIQQGSRTQNAKNRQPVVVPATVPAAAPIPRSTSMPDIKRAPWWWSGKTPEQRRQRQWIGFGIVAVGSIVIWQLLSYVMGPDAVAKIGIPLVGILGCIGVIQRRYL